MSSKKKAKFKDIEIVRAGSQILLPDGMDYDQGIEWLRRKKTEEEKEVAINEQIDAFPLDGAYALWRAISRKYGFAGLVPTPGFWGPTPPAMIGVEVAPRKTVQVPWGSIQIPGINGRIMTEVAQKDGRQIFVIGGIVKQKHKKAIAELADMARDIVLNESIYKGKAIRATFPELDPDDFDPTAHAPKFLDTGKVNQEELIFSEDVFNMVNQSLFTLIEKTDICRKNGIPLKRGVLLEGPYGTGKTLTAYVAAQKAVNNGWTFIYLDTVKNLQRAIYFAQQYGPAVIFAEDIDQILKGGRNDDMNGILNTIDGVDTKGHEIIVCLTTNHVDQINPAMLRPGRLDAVVRIRPPDSEAVQRLLRLYARGLIPEKETLHEVGKMLDGHIPAVIREVVERSKLAAVSRMTRDEPFKLQEQDLIEATKGILAQVELINPKFKEQPHPFAVLGRAVGQEIGMSVLATQAMVGGKEMAFQIPAELLSEVGKLIPSNPSSKSKGNGTKKRT